MIQNLLPILAAAYLMSQKSHPTTPTISYERKNTVELTILGPSGKTTLLPTTSLEVESNDSVLDASIEIFKTNKIPFVVSGVGPARYVSSIDSLGQQDKGPTSGWLYKVNGEWPDESPATYKLKAGDSITWVYTLNLGKDVGAPSVIFEGRNNQINTTVNHRRF